MDFKGDTNDIIIIVVGPTGSGKTRFIGTLSGGAEQFGSGDSLSPDTKRVTPYIIPYNGPIRLQGRLILLDTPGLNEDIMPDAQMLREIIGRFKAKLAGLIYLHRITDNRIPGSIYKNPHLLCRCTDVTPNRARLVTTMWDIVRDKQTAENREREIINFWQPLMDEGAGTGRFDNSSSSAWRIITDILPHDGVVRPNSRNEAVEDDTAYCCFAMMRWMKKK